MSVTNDVCTARCVFHSTRPRISDVALFDTDDRETNVALTRIYLGEFISVHQCAGFLVTWRAAEELLCICGPTKMAMLMQSKIHRVSTDTKDLLSCVYINWADLDVVNLFLTDEAHMVLTNRVKTGDYYLWVQVGLINQPKENVDPSLEQSEVGYFVTAQAIRPTYGDFLALQIFTSICPVALASIFRPYSSLIDQFSDRVIKFIYAYALRGKCCDALFKIHQDDAVTSSVLKRLLGNDLPEERKEEIEHVPCEDFFTNEIPVMQSVSNGQTAWCETLVLKPSAHWCNLVRVFALLTDVLAYDQEAVTFPVEYLRKYVVSVLDISSHFDFGSLDDDTFPESRFIVDANDIKIVGDFIRTFKKPTDLFPARDYPLNPAIQVCPSALRFFESFMSISRPLRYSMLEGVGIVTPKIMQLLCLHQKQAFTHAYRLTALSSVRPQSQPFPRTREEEQMELYMLWREYQKHGLTPGELALNLVQTRALAAGLARQTQSNPTNTPRRSIKAKHSRNANA